MSVPVIRTPSQGVAWLRARIGDTWITAEDRIPLEVDGHCLGIVGREYLGQASGYGYAYEVANELAHIGALKLGTAPFGVTHLWLGGPGHIATDCGSRDVICNVGLKIGITPWSSYRNMDYRGWAWPWEVPGWGPLKPIVTPPASALHVIRVGGRTALTRAEVIRQSTMSTLRFNQHNKARAVFLPGQNVVVPETCLAIAAGLGR